MARPSRLVMVSSSSPTLEIKITGPMASRNSGMICSSEVGGILLQPQDRWKLLCRQDQPKETSVGKASASICAVKLGFGGSMSKHTEKTFSTLRKLVLDVQAMNGIDNVFGIKISHATKIQTANFGTQSLISASHFQWLVIASEITSATKQRVCKC